jgi:hypothetical protein
MYGLHSSPYASMYVLLYTTGGAFSHLNKAVLDPKHAVLAI